MRTAFEEHARLRLLKFGRKNKCCRLLAVIAMAAILFVFNGGRYLAGNGKRFAMMTMSFCLFVVFSSFSFPQFITGDGAASEIALAESASDVELAPETELDLNDVELLGDEDVLDGTETDVEQSSAGMDSVDTYAASEILNSMENLDLEPAEEDNDGTEEFSEDDWRLILINKQHSIPEDYTFSLGTIAGSLQCDERILDDLRRMLTAAQEDGVSLVVCSPYRSSERQVYLFQRKIKRYMAEGMSYMEAYQLGSQAVTVPGNSEHEVGLALDIVCNSYMNLDEGFCDTEAGKWLAAHSCEYGFILRYPEGKEYETGIEYEPWHFRYVGVDAATLIMENGWCLEEFWEEVF